MKAAASLASSLVASILVITVFLIFKSTSNSSLGESEVKKSNQQHRVAILIPFLCDGPESIPPYLNLFVTAAAGSSSLVDFFIFHDGVLDYFYFDDMPANVKLINLGSTQGMMEHFVRGAVDRRTDEEFAFESREILVKILTSHVPRYPYVLVEFKPALGHIFRDYIQGYTHWGYSDLDIVFGDLASWITTEELDDFDIVTYGFGDADRVYLRGQFTIHQNKPNDVNQLWRGCEYLSKMDERFADILSGKTKLHFESAEACYSVKAFQGADVNIKFAVKAFTDVHQSDVAYTHGMYFSTGGKGSRSVLYKAVDASDGKLLTNIDEYWFEDPEYAIEQVEYGQKLPLRWLKDPLVNCMYWVREIYQSELCIAGATAGDTIYLNNGHLFKRNFENENLPTGIASAPFFHFQEWKRCYRYNQNADVTRKTKSSWVLTKEGALPLSTSDENSGVASPLDIDPSAWKGRREQLPPHPYCIISGRRKFPPVPLAPGCELVISWRNDERVELVSKAPGWRLLKENDTTLALTLQITAKQADSSLDSILNIAILNVESWTNQPIVLVVHLAGATEVNMEYVRTRLREIASENCLIALVAQTETSFVSRKALMNMAIDAAPTRWVVNGVELERGVVVSNEAATLCRRQAKIHTHGRGHVFFIPQFAITASNGESSKVMPSIVDILRWKKENPFLVRHPHDFEDGSCEGADFEASNELFDTVEELWWKLTTLRLDGIDGGNENLISDASEALIEFERLLLRAIADDEGGAVSSDDSPILMVDNRGPHPGVRTSSFVREIEEFAGKQCYNAFRLSQLAGLGYDISVLPGAFAASTKATRDAALTYINEDELGASRCDGCIMFQGENEEILDAIFLEERTRICKAAVLWGER